MTDPIITKAARRLKIGKDLSVLADAWKGEQIEIVLSIPLADGKKQVINTLGKVHTLDEFVEFVDQLALEAEQHG